MIELEYDIFGLAMKDYLKGERGNIIRVNTNITEDEELPVDYLFRTKEELPEWEKLALNLCKGKILDVGAGAGCHSKILTDEGHNVHPIDIAPLSVKGMQEQGLNKAQAIDYFDLDSKYDTILFLMNGIGLAQKIEGLTKVFNKAKKLLSEGGQILLESSDIIYMFEEEDGSVAIDLNGHYYGEMEYTISYKETTAPPFNWLYVGYELLEDKAIGVGLKCENIFQGENGNYLARLTL